MPFYQSAGQPERRRRDLHYDDRTPPARSAAALTGLHGFLLGKSLAAVTPQKSVSVAVYERSGTDSDGKAIWLDTGLRVTAWDWFLNESDEIEADTKVAIAWYRTCWVIIQAYCDPVDTPPGSTSPPSQSSFGNPNIGPMALRRQRR